jgi:predicted transcriptional regulator
MELHFTPEQQARIAQMATKAGTDPEHLVRNAVLRLLDEDARFVDAVTRGEAALERGQFLAHEEVGDRLRRYLEP